MIFRERELAGIVLYLHAQPILSLGRNMSSAYQQMFAISPFLTVQHAINIGNCGLNRSNFVTDNGSD